MDSSQNVPTNFSGIVSTLNNLVIAVNNLNKTIEGLPLNAAPTTASAGASSGLYATIIADNGNAYKIELLDVS